MNEAESKYWDRIAESLTDNVWKRAEIVKRLLSLDLYDKDVLEIGTGLGTAAGALNVVLIGRWRYKGTDISKKNCELVRNAFRLETVQTGITDLPFPDASFDVVFALDTLEHVRPEERMKGYSEIDRVLKPSGTVAINIPLEETQHDLDFDHGFLPNDLYAIWSVCKLSPETYETYAAKLPDEVRYYAWAVGVR